MSDSTRRYDLPDLRRMRGSLEEATRFLRLEDGHDSPLVSDVEAWAADLDTLHAYLGDVIATLELQRRRAARARAQELIARKGGRQSKRKRKR